MAGFCRYWRIPPTEYYRLTVAQVSAMYEYMAEERRAIERERNRRR